MSFKNCITVLITLFSIMIESNFLYTPLGQAVASPVFSNIWEIFEILRFVTILKRDFICTKSELKMAKNIKISQNIKSVQCNIETTENSK